MQFTVRIDFLGLYVVREGDGGDSHHRIIAPRAEGVAGNRGFEFLLWVRVGEPPSVSGFLQPAGNIVPLPSGTILSTTTPVANVNSGIVSPIPTFVPAKLSDLGLGSLRPGVGEGDLDAQEYGRVLLPTARSTPLWIYDLGYHTASAASHGSLAEVADRFIWFGTYEDSISIDATSTRNAPSTITVRPHMAGGASGNVAIEILYKERPPNTAGAPFDYAGALAGISTESWAPENQPRRPEGAAAKPPHPGTSSCPPVKG